MRRERDEGAPAGRRLGAARAGRRDAGGRRGTQGDAGTQGRREAGKEARCSASGVQGQRPGKDRRLPRERDGGRTAPPGPRNGDPVRTARTLQSWHRRPADPGRCEGQANGDVPRETGRRRVTKPLAAWIPDLGESWFRDTEKRSDDARRSHNDGRGSADLLVNCGTREYTDTRTPQTMLGLTWMSSAWADSYTSSHCRVGYSGVERNPARRYSRFRQ